MKKGVLFFFMSMLVVSYVFADETVIQMRSIDDQGVGKNIGTVTAADSQYGLLLTPQLRDLPPVASHIILTNHSHAIMTIA